MHEMRSAQLPQIFEEVYRVIKPGGLFILVDFHLTNPVFLGRVGGVCWQKWDGDRTIPKKISNQNFMLAATFK
jgi:ubiquinone/menaquinone biosynthesis C-methylase UbiE